MAEEKSPSPEEPEKTQEEETGSAALDKDKAPEKESASSIRWMTLVVLLICIGLFAWYVQADRHTPYTDQARVKGLIIPIVPRVSGYLTRLNFRLHSQIEPGDTLFQLDQRPFLLAVKAAEANLDRAIQSVGARTATVKSSAGRLGVARAQLDRAQRNWDRVQMIMQENPGALSLADRDQAETALAQAVEQVASAEADLERAKEQLGVAGPDNPQIRAAIVNLEQAQLDLAFSTYVAFARGVIESFNVDVGHYCSAGQPLATFVSRNTYWIEADMRENNLSHLKAGDPVEFALDVAPGRVFEGKVRSIGYGVDAGDGVNRGELPKVSQSKGWLRDPQRFPVIITFEGEEIFALCRLGGQVDVIAYTGDHSWLNPIGRWQIRLSSFLSYVR